VTLYKHNHISRILVAGALLGLVGCGAGQRPTNSGNFSGAVASESESESSASHAAVASVKLSSAYARGGTSSKITVNMTRPAPGDGAVVQLKSSDASVVTIPATTNPPCRTTDAAEEVGSEAGRVWIELMLKAFCRNACLWPLRGQARASGKR